MGYNTRRRLGLFAVLFTALTVPGVANAGDVSFTWQTRLIDPFGEPIAGAHDVTLTLYDDGGTPRWSKQYSNIPFGAGYGAVEITGLDDNTPAPRDLDDVVFTPGMEIGIQVDGAAELEPRQRLGMVPLAAAALSASSSAGGGRTTGPMTLFVRTDGSDTACDGSADASAASAPACAFASPQAAHDAIPDVIMHPVTMNIGPGTYRESPLNDLAVLAIKKTVLEPRDKTVPYLLTIRQTPASGGTVIFSGSPTDDVNNRVTPWGISIKDTRHLRLQDIDLRHFANQAILSEASQVHAATITTGGGGGTVRVEQGSHWEMASALVIDDGDLYVLDSRFNTSSHSLTVTDGGITGDNSTLFVGGAASASRAGHYTVTCRNHSYCWFGSTLSATASLSCPLLATSDSRLEVAATATVNSGGTAVCSHAGSRIQLTGFDINCGGSGPAFQAYHGDLLTYYGTTKSLTSCASAANITNGRMTNEGGPACSISGAVNVAEGGAYSKYSLCGLPANSCSPGSMCW